MAHFFKKSFLSSWPVVPAVLVVIIMWQFAGRLLAVREYLFPVPTSIFLSASKHWTTLLLDSGVTFLEATAALMVASVLAFTTAVCFQLSSILRKSFLPLLIASKSVPIVVFAPLFALWFGYGPSGKVVLAFIVAFLPVAVNATFGMDSVSKEQLDLFRLHSAGAWKTLWKLRVPTAVPFVIPALRLSATLAVLGVVIGEMTGAKNGLGATILITSATLDTPLLFAAALCALLVCGGLLFLISLVEVAALRRYRFDLNKQTEA